MNMFRAFMELDEAYNDRHFHIDELKKAGKNYNFDKYTDAQLYRVWQRLQKPAAVGKEPAHELDLDFEPERDFDRCECGMRLTDFGACPVCDLGEEDLTEALTYCWFGYYLDKDGKKKIIYATQDSTSHDADEAAEKLEDMVPEPYTKFVFRGNIDNRTAEREGWTLVESAQKSTLSDEQKAFFAQSKIRDSQGNLMVFYHGTNKDFSTFAPETVGGGGPLGVGYYFSSKSATGKVFGSVKSVYLNIKNPMIFKTAKQPRDFLLAMCQKYHISPSAVAKEGKPLNYKITELLQKDGYDGVLCYFTQSDEYWCVAYRPEQIKSIDNLTPTSSANMNEGIFDSKPVNRSSWLSASGNKINLNNMTAAPVQSQPTSAQTQQSPKPHLPSGRYAVRIVSHGGRLRALATDGVHPAAWVAFPNDLRQFEGQQYEVDQLIWNGKNYRVAGNIVEI